MSILRNSHKLSAKVIQQKPKKAKNMTNNTIPYKIGNMIPFEKPQSKIESKNIQELITRHEEETARILSLNWSILGFSEQELKDNTRFKKRLEDMTRKAKDDPQELLKLMEQNGIAIMSNSHYLKEHQSPTAILAAHSGWNGEKKINAIFMTPHQAQQVIEATLKKKRNPAWLKDMEQVVKRKGVIFLSKSPTPKSVFHESSHAIQVLENLEMETSREIRTKREMEVNAALIALKSQGLLKGVTRGDYKITGRSPFGDVVVLSPNDIYQEVDYFLSNERKLKKVQ